MRTSNSLRRLTVGAVGMAVAASLLTPSHAAAAPRDPEQLAIETLRGNAESTAPALTLPQGPRALVSSAQANWRIRSLLPRRLFYPAAGRNIAVSVIDAVTGQGVAGYRGSVPLLPASNMKIVTAANALRVLRPQKRFETKIVTLGRGRIAIVGGGDATLSRTGLRALAATTIGKLRKHPELLPPRGVPMRIFVDETLYPTPTRPPGWRPDYMPYTVRPVRALGIDGSYVWDSSAQAAQYFSLALTGFGLKTFYSGKVNATGRPTFSNYFGLPLSAQIVYMLQVSENNIAEMLYRNVAVARGLNPTWFNSNRAARDTLSDLGVAPNGLSLTSGSGVSRLDRLTANSLTRLLEKIANRNDYPELAHIFYGGGLPLAGRTGTLSSSTGRFNTRPTSCAAGRLRAKTGTLFDTIALSGLTPGRDGHLKAFSILVNSRPQSYAPLDTRRSIDQIAATVNGCF